MKSNKIWRIALIAVLCLAMLFTAACQPTEPDPTDGTTPSGTTPPAGDVNVPTEDGKVTFYFTLGEGSPAQDSFASYFLTGGVTNWATGNTGELEFQQLNDSNVYYCITDLTIDPTASQGLDYQLLVGYNATSGMSQSEQGIKWDDSRKSDVSAAPGGLNNPTYEWAEGQNTVNLGTHIIEKKLSAPKTIDTTLVVTFKEALPEGASVAMYGSMNNWGNSGVEVCICTVSEDRLSASLKLENALVADYEFKVVVYAPGVEVNSETQWTGTAYGAGDGNASFSIGTLDENEEIPVMRDVEYTAPTGISATLRVTFSEAVAEGSIVHMYGNFQGWGYKEGACEMTSEDGKVWTITVPELATGELQFKVLVFAAGSTAFDWGDATVTYGNGEGNFTYEITADHADQTVDVATITVG